MLTYLLQPELCLTQLHPITPLLFLALRASPYSLCPFETPTRNVWMGLSRNRGQSAGHVQLVFTPCLSFMLTLNSTVFILETFHCNERGTELTLPTTIWPSYRCLFSVNISLPIGISFSFHASWTPSSSPLLVLKVLKSESSSRVLSHQYCILRETSITSQVHDTMPLC